MKKILLVLLFLSFFKISYGQKNTFQDETAALNCFYISFKDGGVHLKTLIKKAENTLIEVGILKDSSGASYLNMFKNLKTLDTVEIKSLGLANLITDVMVEKKEFDMNRYTSCVEAIINQDGFKESAMYHNLTYIRTFATTKIKNSTSEIWREVSKRFTAEDFTHDYYKVAIFTMIENYKTPPVIEEKEVIETPVFKIMIEGKNTVKVNGSEISLDALKEKLKTYYEIHTSKSRTMLRVDGETMMSTVGDVKKIMRDVVQSLRDELALKKFKRSYHELTQAQQKELKEIYPSSW